MIVHIMQHVIRIREIERQAKQLNISLLDLCRRSGVSYSSVRRWERGTVEPKVGTLERELSALNAGLVAARKKMLAVLAGAAE